MSTTAPRPLPEDVPAPQTVAEAIASLHHSSHRMAGAADKLLSLAELSQETPEMHTVIINPGNSGNYQTIDKSYWRAKSLGIYNPGSALVYVGVGGVSARTTSRALTVPGAAAATLPVEAQDIELGCDPAALGANTAVIYVFRYVTVQPLILSV